MLGVQGAQRVDDVVLRAVRGVRQGAHHRDRIVGAAVPQQELRQQMGHLPHAVGLLGEGSVDVGRPLHVAALLQHLGQTPRGVPVVLGVGVRAQFLDPSVPGQQIGQRVPAVDRRGLPAAQQGDRLVDAALPFPDGGEQGEGVGRLNAQPVAVGVVTGRDRGLDPGFE